MPDISFKTDTHSFSYRAAAICMENGAVLLQKADNDPGYAFPGGQVAFGETNAETLLREFREELGAEIEVGELAWVGELFYPSGARQCQQICLFYRVTLLDSHTPRSGTFPSLENTPARKNPVFFQWIPLEALPTLTVYPSDAPHFLANPTENVRHFLYRES